MRVYLIDGNGIAHWQYHSKATDQNGNELDLCAKVARWWADFCERMAPTHAVVCFDGKRNWRKELYPEYKATRRAKPIEPEKIEALNKMPALWGELGVRVIHHDQFEADDVIATLCAMFSGDAEIVTIATDKDMMQLVEQFDGSPKQYDPRPNKAGECVFYDSAKVEDKLGVPPHRIAELLAIMGDSSDDVPGIDGIGRVQAVNAIRQTKTAAEIFRRATKHELKEITAKNQDKIAAGRDAFDLSLKLVTLRYDVPISVGIDDCIISGTVPQSAA